MRHVRRIPTTTCSALAYALAGCHGSIRSEPPDACDLPLSAEERAYVPQGSAVEDDRAPCVAVMHPTAGAAGSVLRVTLSAFDGQALTSSSMALISATDVAGRELLAPAAVSAGTSVSFPLAATGEVFVTLQPRDLADAGGAYRLTVECAEGCDRGYTRYPLLLLHGMGGGSELIGGDYFFDVRDRLTAQGYVVHNPAVPAYLDSLARAEAWRAHVDEMLADGHLGRRVNLVGHSQGGIDARALASSLGDDRIASIVTIGTPHRGTLVADAFAGTVSGLDPDLVAAAVEAVANVYGADASESDFAAQMDQLTTARMAEFNVENPDVDGVVYRSWAGSTCSIFDTRCVDAHDGESIEPVMAPMLYLMMAADIDSDGLVPVDSATWTGFAGVINADHADEIGQFMDAATDAFDHRAFYDSEATWLRENGL